MVTNCFHSEIPKQHSAVSLSADQIGHSSVLRAISFAGYPRLSSRKVSRPELDTALKNEKIYSVFGQLLVFAILVLIVFSLYWGWISLVQMARTVVPDPFSFLLALAACAGLVLAARSNVSLSLILILLLAALNRLYLTETHQAFGWIALFLAVFITLGELSEKVKWVRDRFPKVLMIVLGIAFLGPVAVIVKVLSVLRIIPTSTKD